MLSFNVAKQLSSVFLLETLKSSTNANTGEIALKKSPCETHGKVEYVVFKAQVAKKILLIKKSFNTGCLPFGQEAPDTKNLSTDNTN